jgi:two-component system response regulator MtrA
MSARRQQLDRILVVDDDTALAEMLTIVLEGDGFDARSVHTGRDALAALQEFKPSLVLLDLMLPEIDGMQVCRAIREISTVPIIMLTARADTPDVVAGLEAGADDYITKPFRNKELIARIRVRLRRARPVSTRIEFGEIVMDTEGHTAERAGRALPLTKLEYDLLACLISAPERVFTREALLEEVWGYHHPGDTKLVNVHMTRLRSKIEDNAEFPTIIRTVRGVGYQAIAPTEHTSDAAPTGGD